MSSEVDLTVQQPSGTADLPLLQGPASVLHSSGVAQAPQVRPLCTGQGAELCGWKQRSKVSLGLCRAPIPEEGEDLVLTFQLGTLIEV